MTSSQPQPHPEPPAHRTIPSDQVGAQVWGDVPDRLHLVFDGYCGFCTRTVRLLDRIDRHDKVTVSAAQQPDTVSATGVTPDEGTRSAWAVAPNGYRVSGAPAVALALAVALGTRAPLLPWKAPLLPGLLDRVYQWIADNRSRLRGDTPWCEQHPDRCPRA